MHRFVYLKLGLGLVLVWVGIKLVLQVDLWKMPTWLSLGVVASIITIAIVASLRATRGQPEDPAEQTRKEALHG
jgi:tellurite resistance protein TerC